jgi:hypothetical protein
MTEGPAGAGADQGKPGYRAREQVTRPRLDDRPGPAAHPPTEYSGPPPHPPTEYSGPPPHPPTEYSGPPPHPPTEYSGPPPYPPTEYSGPASYQRTMPARQVPASAAAQATAPPANQPAAPPRSAPAAGPAPQAGSRQPASDVLRYGPGVPPSQAGVSAEQVWRTGQMPDPPRRPVRLRRLGSLAVTVILLVAAGVLLFLRFHHAPFSVTGAPSLTQAQNGCTVNVTGRISTNGAAGTISYEWVFTPQQQAPQPLSQSVVSGQHAVYVTVAVEGQGRGSATQEVALQILGPNQETASTVVKVSC